MGKRTFCTHHRTLWLGLIIGAMTLLSGSVAQAGCSITRVSSWTYDQKTGLMTSEAVQPTSPVGTLTPTNCAGITTATATTTTTYEYDAYGNKISVSVAGSDSANSNATVAARTTTTAYDSQGEFPTTITNTLGQSESWSYDPKFGVPTSHTGPNGLTTTWFYDTLGRKTSEWLADGTVTGWQYYYTTNYPVWAFYIFETKSYYSSATGFVQRSPNIITCYDELSRPTTKYIQAYQTVGATTSLTWAVETTTYDALGRVASADTVPIFGTNPTSYTYDALGRPLTVSAPKAPNTLLKQLNYNGLTTSVEAFSAYSSANSNTGETTTTTNNALGQPISVTNTYGKTTSNAYDAIGDLLSITDPNGNVASYTYDNEGRKLTMADPNRGNWSYTYDALGEPLTETSPNQNQAGTQTSYFYDPLGRLVERVQATAPGIQQGQTDTWTYNNGPQSSCPTYQGVPSACTGKLASEASSNNGGLISQKAITYDAVGRPVVTTVQPTAAPSSYNFTTSYNEGVINTVTYPSGYAVQYGYDTTLGNLNALTCTANCTLGASAQLWTLNTTNAADQVLTETYGNGITVTNTYGAYINNIYTAKGNLLTAVAAGPGATSNTAGNFTYTYDDLGNLVTRTDGNLNLSETLSYDSLYRLSQDTLTNSSPQNPISNVTLTYDALGNIITKSDVGTYNYGGTGVGPDAISSITCTSGTACPGTYTYDADGNTTSGNGYTEYWTSFDMAANLSMGTTSFAYTYDADHNRVTQTQTTAGAVTTTDYINDAASGQHSEYVASSSGTGGVWTDYLTVGKELLGIHITTPVTGGACGSTATNCNRFFIRDHLGSVAVVTDDGGNVLERDLYDPWGKRRNSAVTPNASVGTPDTGNTVTSKTTRGFTGQEMVQNGAGFELVNLNARFYDPTIGRFLSTDPQLPQAGLAADLINPYSYCDNNPLSITDTTGQSFLGILGAIVGIIIAAVLIWTTWGAAMAGYVLSATGTMGMGASASSIVTGAIVGSISGAADSAIASGGNLTASLEGLGIGAATGAGFGIVGHFTDPEVGTFDAAIRSGSIAAAANASPYALAQFAGDGLVGGLSSVAEGGNFQSGFLAAGFSNVFGNAVLANNGGGALSGTQIAYNTAAEAITGGIGSVIGGGSFEDGAITGSFRYLFNSVGAANVWEHANMVSYLHEQATQLYAWIFGGSADFVAGTGEGGSTSFYVNPETGQHGEEVTANLIDLGWMQGASPYAGMAKISTIRGFDLFFGVSTPVGGINLGTTTSLGFSSFTFSGPGKYGVNLGLSETCILHQGC